MTFFMCNHDLTENFSSNAKFKPEYFTSDDFQVIIINISLRVVSIDIT